MTVITPYIDYNGNIGQKTNTKTKNGHKNNITSDHCNLTKKATSPPHTDGSFARWHQCALPCNTCFLGPTRVLNPNGISIRSAVFTGLTTVTDRQTNRPRYFPGRIYVRSTAMRPKK